MHMSYIYEIIRKKKARYETTPRKAYIMFISNVSAYYGFTCRKKKKGGGEENIVIRRIFYNIKPSNTISSSMDIFKIRLGSDKSI